MPGRRNYARERAEHAAAAPSAQSALYELLRSQLPERERALVGRERILDFLTTQLYLRRRNGTRLTWRMVLRWHRDLGFPLVRGVWHPRTARHPSSRSPALTTTYAATAFVLSQFSTDSQGLFRVGHPPLPSAAGRRPENLVWRMPRNTVDPRGIGKGRWVRPLAVVSLPSAPHDSRSGAMSRTGTRPGLGEA